MNRRTFFGGLIATAVALVAKPFAKAEKNLNVKFQAKIGDGWKDLGEIQDLRIQVVNDQMTKMHDYGNGFTSDFPESVFDTELYKFWKKELEGKKFKHPKGEVQAVFKPSSYNFYKGSSVSFYTNVLNKNNLTPERVADLIKYRDGFYAMQDTYGHKAIRKMWRA